jgi:hypothetical protein
MACRMKISEGGGALPGRPGSRWQICLNGGRDDEEDCEWRAGGGLGGAARCNNNSLSQPKHTQPVTISKTSILESHSLGTSLTTRAHFHVHTKSPSP